LNVVYENKGNEMSKKLRLGSKVKHSDSLFVATTKIADLAVLIPLFINKDQVFET
jgi:hypothetical protein